MTTPSEATNEATELQPDETPVTPEEKIVQEAPARAIAWAEKNAKALGRIADLRERVGYPFEQKS